MQNFSGPNIYQYVSSREFLKDVLDFRKAKNPSYSLRAYSQQMGFANHTLIHFLLSGKRSVKPDHVPNLLRGLKLKKKEEDYFLSLVKFENAQTLFEKEIYEKALKNLRPNKTLSFVDLDKFRLVSSWYHFAILEMTTLKDFNSDPEWISKRLGGKVSKKSIKEAIDRLVKLGLLRLEDETLLKTHASITTKDSVPSTAVREYHHNTISLALEAIEGQTVQERILNSCSLTIDVSKLPEAQELILDFRRKMVALLEKNNGDETYQLNVQLFKLTQGEGAK